MSDVVAKLKLTSKGSLPYSNNWNPVDLLDSISFQQTSQIKPFALKSSSKLVRLNQVKTPYNDYEVYFSPERKDNTMKTKDQKNLSPDKSSGKAWTYRSGRCSENQPVIDRKYSLPLQCTVEGLLTNFKHDLEIKSQDSNIEMVSKNMNDLRLREFNATFKEIDEKYYEQVEEIEECQQLKILQERDLLQRSENITSSEINLYKKLQEEAIAKTKRIIQQGDFERKQIQDELRKRNEARLRQKEKLKRLGELPQAAEKIVANIKSLRQKFQECDDDSYQARFSQLFIQTSKDFNDCLSLITYGINNPSKDLDALIQQASGKVKDLENDYDSCQKLAIEMDNLNQERLRRAEEEEKRKSAEANKPIVTITQPSTNETVSTRVVDKAISNIPSNLSLENVVPALAPIESTLRPILTMCVPKSGFQEYLHLQSNLQNVIKQHEPVSKSSDKAIKTFKFDVYKVINTTINALSDESPKHLLDKIMKINTFFTGKDILMGGKKVTIKDSNYGSALAKELLAKKIVLQGAQQVSSSFKTAFPIAAFAVGIWSLFPDVGELMLAHFNLNCPFLVPFYIPKSKEMSTVDYCKLVGYSVDGQDIEPEDKYLKKMSGIVRLYAAILQTDVPPQLGDKKHPHGIEHGWIWFTRLLNLEPRPSVTATLIFDFLEVAGHVMLKRFGKQFRKILLTLCNDYMPKILNVSSPSSKAAEMRLKMFLDECIKTGKLKEPEGRISVRWWGTGRH